MSTYLIDTHLLYWWLTADSGLSEATVHKMQQADIIVSAATLWEMILKNRKGKLPLPDEPLHQSVTAQGFRIVPMTSSHLEVLRGLDVRHEYRLIVSCWPPPLQSSVPF